MDLVTEMDPIPFKLENWSKKFNVTSRGNANSVKIGNFATKYLKCDIYKKYIWIFPTLIIGSN